MLKNKLQAPEYIFRAYDIRGTYPEDLNPDVVYNIGLAFGSEAQSQGQKKVIIAKDGRLSGPVLIKALAEGLKHAGCDVIDVGSVPTPVLYFATKKIGTGTGIMLTGSHNPANYNGLKMMINHTTLAEEAIQALKNRIDSGEVNFSDQGSHHQQDIANAYIDYICENESLARNLHIVIDAGNGIAGEIAPKLYQRLGCQVETLYCEVDGAFPNHHPDPSKPENLQDLIEKVRETGADVGLAFDGDGDRLGVVTPNGENIFPDRQLMLYAKDVLEANKAQTILYDVKCSKNVELFVKAQGGNPVMSKTGHALIKKKMLEIDAALAGEMSGHVFFNDRWFGFDDGLYTGVRLLEILSQHNKSLDEIFSEIPQSINTPEINITVPESKKFQVVDALMKGANSQFKNAKIITIDGVRAEFEKGWGLVRASNTTPCLVLRFEADTKEDLIAIQSEFSKWVNETVELIG
ncbi:phosphomannomutase/phosphoglucomutase [Fangia hongkongensis]|uniref:phosphomannomutase/phosphoglucomutase n=1 Tax=Fangia hongkongensis TaxID=270495 RepID=UPI00037518B6|nr:phosphomannomutase/phosphoglucomutase [Fangia hongkongensis]